MDPDRKPRRSIWTLENPAPRTAASTAAAGGLLLVVQPSGQMRVELDASHVATEVTHAQVMDIEMRLCQHGTYRALGPVDAHQVCRGDRDAEGHPARQAGSRGLVPGRQAPPPRRLPHVRLGQARVQQRGHRTTLCGCPDAGTEAGDRVVGIGSGGDVLQPQLGGQRPERVEQLGLAVEAAVAVIGAVALALHLVRARTQQPHVQG